MEEDHSTPIRKSPRTQQADPRLQTQPTGPSVAQVMPNPAAEFNEVPDMGRSEPVQIPVPTGPSQGQDLRGSTIERFNVFKKDLFKDFDIKTLVIVFILVVIASSSFLITMARKYFPSSVDTDGLLLPVSSLIIGIVASVLYAVVVIYKNNV